MARLPVIRAPDPRLKRRCRPVAAVDDRVRRLLRDLFDTMYAAPGIGLAAPQVGVPERVVVVDVAGADEPPAPIGMVNPRVVAASDETAVFEEGCLSLPTHYADVERPARVRVAWLDETGAAREMDAHGLLATCIQHEIDHLDGVLFVDRISRVRRAMILRRLAKAKRADPGRHMAA